MHAVLDVELEVNSNKIMVNGRLQIDR